MLATYTKSAMAALLCPWCHATDQIKSKSKVVMRHGQSPRYADVPYAWLLAVHPCHCAFRRCWGYPSLLLTDSRRLERQFLDPISTHQNKVRDVTKESQGMISCGASHLSLGD